MLVRRGDEFFAVSAFCSHYHGPLAEGLLVGDTVRCPWHHACFSLRTGEALRAPALDAITCWKVEVQGDQLFVREKLPARATAPAPRSAPDSIVIVGGGAAGLAAADMLRREGYDGPLTMISADDSPPCDRPNLSKDYLAGTAQEDWIPLRPASYYDDQRIDLLLNSRVASLDLRHKRVTLADGGSRGYGVAPDRHRRRSGAAGHSRRRVGTGALPPHLRRQQGDRGPVGFGEAGRRGGGKLHRARGGGVPPRTERRGSRRWPRERPARAGHGTGGRAGSSAACTRVTASPSTWARRSHEWTGAR